MVPNEARPTNSLRQFSAKMEGWMLGLKVSEFSSELPNIFCSLEIFLDLPVQIKEMNKILFISQTFFIVIMNFKLRYYLEYCML